MEKVKDECKAYGNVQAHNHNLGDCIYYKGLNLRSSFPEQAAAYNKDFNIGAQKTSTKQNQQFNLAKQAQKRRNAP